MIGRIHKDGKTIATLSDDGWLADDPDVATYLRKNHTPLRAPSYMSGVGAVDLRIAAEALGGESEYFLDTRAEPGVTY